jgi:hypothetical protein
MKKKIIGVCLEKGVGKIKKSAFWLGILPNPA